MAAQAVFVIPTGQKVSVSRDARGSRRKVGQSKGRNLGCISLKMSGIMHMCRDRKLEALGWHPPCVVSVRTPPGSTKLRSGEMLLGDTMNKKQKGFSLIELLIVVAIILIIAAIAIPNLLRARMAANESSAVGSLRTIVTAEFNYQQNYGIGYAPLANLGSPAPCTPA